MTGELLERRAGQRADRVEGDIAEQLDPDLVAKARRNRTAKPGSNQRFDDSAQPVGLRAVGFAEADLVAFGMPDHARLHDVGREVGQRADDAPGLDRRGDDTSWIDPLQAEAIEFTAVRLEIPPRDAVLRADNHRVGAEEGPQLRRERRQAVSLDTQHDDVGVTDGTQIAGHFGPDFEVSKRAYHPQPALLHGAEMWTAREEQNVVTASSQQSADVTADRAGAGDDELHDALALCLNDFAIAPRCILPVAVRGSVSVM